MRKRLSLALLLTVVALSAAAEVSKKGVNGGDVVVIEGHPIEFVSKGQEISFYILGDDSKTPTPTKGATARAECSRPKAPGTKSGTDAEGRKPRPWYAGSENSSQPTPTATGNPAGG